MEEIRLNKWLSQLGVCSRREADRLIESGKVTVDDKIAQMGQKVSKAQKIICGGKLVWEPGGSDVPPSRQPEPVWLVVNKPKGIVCTTSPKDRAKTIVELVSCPERVYPVGRLDKDSRGLILMTNQGDLVNKMMRSGNAHEKEYEVQVDRPVTGRFLEAVAGGVELAGLNQRTRPCWVEAMGERVSHYPDPGLKPSDPADVPGFWVSGAGFKADADYEYPFRKPWGRKIPPDGRG